MNVQVAGKRPSPDPAWHTCFGAFEGKEGKEPWDEAGALRMLLHAMAYAIGRATCFSAWCCRA